MRGCSIPATLTGIDPEEDARVLRFECPADLVRCMVTKGPIALDGVSFTLVDVVENGFAVSMVQHTAAHTTMGSSRVGDQVNVESDLIARYVARAVAARLAPQT
jgi:riboflavin synthase